MQMALELVHAESKGCWWSAYQLQGTYTCLPAKVHAALLIDTPAVDNTGNGDSMSKA